MSNIIDHDAISSKIEKLFKNAMENVTEGYLKTEEQILTEEIAIGKNGISFCDGNLIHFDANKDDSYSIHKDTEAGKYKISIINLEDDTGFEVENVSTFNISDIPSAKVEVGNSAVDLFKLFNAIELVSESIKADTNLVIEEREKKEKKQRKTKSFKR